MCINRNSCHAKPQKLSPHVHRHACDISQRFRCSWAWPSPPVSVCRAEQLRCRPVWARPSRSSGRSNCQWLRQCPQYVPDSCWRPCNEWCLNGPGSPPCQWPRELCIGSRACWHRRHQRRSAPARGPGRTQCPGPAAPSDSVPESCDPGRCDSVN